MLTGKKRNRVLLKAGILGGLALLVLLWPAKSNVDGDCAMQALHRAVVVPEITARVESVLVHEGDHVKAGQVLAQLDVHRLRWKWKARSRRSSATWRMRTACARLGDEAGAQVSLLEVKVLDQQEKKLQADIDSATLRSPIDGVVMTKDLELRAGEVLQQGAPFAEIDDLDGWQLHVEINERDISTVEEALKERGPLDLTYILYSQSAYVLHARLDAPAADLRGGLPAGKGKRLHRDHR